MWGKKLLQIPQSGYIKLKIVPVFFSPIGVFISGVGIILHMQF